MKTMDELIAAARRAGMARVALVSAAEASVLEAVVAAFAAGLATPILIGDPEKIRSVAAGAGLDIAAFEILAAASPREAALAGVKLVVQGRADMLMKGLVDTSVLLKAVLDRETGLNAGRLVSHVAVMEVPSYHKLLFVTDAAINIAPDLAAKLDIVANAVIAARALGIAKPKVAMLAAVEKINAEKMPCTVDAALVAQMNRRGQVRDCVVDGPLALDNAVSAESARVKGIESEVAGDADILVAPDIEAGNILYKCLMDLGGARGAGILMGASRPVVLTSRADSSLTKLASIAFAALASATR